MGVKGLWRLLLPIGRRISIETLEGQILAVDASIWMTQFLKAMRDDQGQARPAAHIIGFFRRLCKLRFHNIKPVFVFDGATPEIKKRELAARRRRRDRFVAQHGAAAVQRMAKRLLVEQLKKHKTMEFGAKKGKSPKKKKKEDSEDDDGGEGALAVGFFLPGESDQQVEEKKEPEIIQLQEEEDNAEWKNHDGEFRIQTRAQSTAGKSMDTAIAVNDNDWDKAINVDQSEEEEEEEEGDKSGSESEEETQYDDVLTWARRGNGKKRKRKQPLRKPQKEDEFLDEDYVLQLDPTERKDAIQEAKKKQRMLSRKEFMPVAGKAQEYSQAQLRNFLRSSKLNRDIVSMAKKAVHLDNNNQEGEVLASDRTRRVVFEKDIDESKESSSEEEEEESSENEEDGDGGGGGFLKTNQRPTAARRKQSKQSTAAKKPANPSRYRIRKMAYQPNTDSEDEEEGGGFFASEDKDKPAGSSTSKKRAIMDDDDDTGGGFMAATEEGDDGSDPGGGFLKSAADTMTKGGCKDLEKNDESDEGGGFVASTPATDTTTTKDSTKPAAAKKKKKKKQVQFTDPTNAIDTGGTEAATKVVAFRPGGFFSKSMEDDDKTTKAAAASTASKKTKGAYSWRGNNKEDGSDEDDDNGSSPSVGLLEASDRAKRTAARVTKRFMSSSQVAARRGASMPFAILRSNHNSDDDDSSQDEPAAAKPRAALKSTGLESDDDANEKEVIVIDGENAQTAQELSDQMLAKALQEEEDRKLAASFADADDNNSDTATAPPPSPRGKTKKAVKWSDPMLAGVERPTRFSTEIFVRSPPKDPPPPTTIITTTTTSRVLKDPPPTATTPVGLSIMMGDDNEPEEEDVDWENGDDDDNNSMNDAVVVDDKGEKKGDNDEASANRETESSRTARSPKDSDDAPERQSGRSKVDTTMDDSDVSEPKIVDVQDSDSEDDGVAWEDGDANENTGRGADGTWDEDDAALAMAKAMSLAEATAGASSPAAGKDSALVKSTKIAKSTSKVAFATESVGDSEEEDDEALAMAKAMSLKEATESTTKKAAGIPKVAFATDDAGDSVDEDDEALAMAKAMSLKEATETALAEARTNAATNNKTTFATDEARDSEEEDVAWEDDDGNTGANAAFEEDEDDEALAIAKAMSLAEATSDKTGTKGGQSVENAFATTTDVGNQRARYEDLGDFEDSNPIDDFGGPKKMDNAAALHHAESTAANLTNWAGRAFRRAVAEHLGVVHPPKQTATPETIPTEESDAVEVWDKDKPADKATEEGQGPTLSEENAEEAEKMLDEFEGELEEVAKNNISRETDAVTDEMQEDIMQLLALFGVPWIRAPAEAEAQCAALEQLGLVNGIVTEDSDVFVFGGRQVYKNIFDDQKYVEIYQADDAEREMGLGHNEMVALAMLLGGDYTEGVKGVGIVNGMEIVSSFDVSVDLKEGLQKFRTWLDGFEPVIDANAKSKDGKALTREQVFHIKHRTARNRWNPPENFPSDAVISAYVDPVVDKSSDKFSWGVPDMENIIAFCNKNAGWVPEDTRRMLEPVIDRVQSKRSIQTRIDQFMRYEHGIKFANVRSKRLRNILSGGRDEEVVDVDISTPKKRRSSQKKTTTNRGSSSAKPSRAAGVAFDSRTVSHADDFEFQPTKDDAAKQTSPYFSRSGGRAAASKIGTAASSAPKAASASAPTESFVRDLASDAFSESTPVDPANINRTKSKVKTKSLSSFLNTVQNKPDTEKGVKKTTTADGKVVMSYTEYSEEYRAKLNKARVPTNRAPPSYSAKSDLVTTLNEKDSESTITPSAPREIEKDD